MELSEISHMTKILHAATKTQCSCSKIVNVYMPTYRLRISPNQCQATNKSQIQETQRTSSKMLMLPKNKLNKTHIHTKEPSNRNRYILFKLQKIKAKEKNLERSLRGKKLLIYRGTKIRVTFDFSEAMKVRREVFKVLRGKKYQPEILYSAQLPFTSEPEGFPGGSVVKNLPANAGDTGSIPDPKIFPIPRSN